jgi:hypothetical protein
MTKSPSVFRVLTYRDARQIRIWEHVAFDSRAMARASDALSSSTRPVERVLARWPIAHMGRERHPADAALFLACDQFDMFEVASPELGFLLHNGRHIVDARYRDPAIVKSAKPASQPRAHHGA